MIEWEKTSNGNWKIKNKVNYNSPEYSRALRLSMKKINPFCEHCDTTYNLAEPCIHHLPDGYKNDMRRKAYYKKVSEKKTDDTNAKQGSL